MKKFLCFLLSVILIMSLSACIMEDVPIKEEGKEQSQSVSEKKDTTYKLNDAAVFKDLKFTATEIKESNGDGFFEPESGNVFVGVKFTIENISDEEQSVSSLLLFEGYVDDVKSSYSLSAACAFDEGTLDGTVAAGKKLVGWYALEVPENWSTIELDVQSSWLSNSSAKFVFENK
ncbi:MAG: DUF4352 domain-containing protein [Ruminococcaceae bacterium]|nr:DUF4352 domain-containing protein [Oscillospiraceae bacterium]